MSVTPIFTEAHFALEEAEYLAALSGKDQAICAAERGYVVRPLTKAKAPIEVVRHPQPPRRVHRP